jgi:hypothetical protein
LDDALNMPDVKAEAIKVSEFWTHNPRGWFLQLEAQFLVRTTPVPAINKFCYVIAGLPSNILEQCSDLTSVVPTDTSFDQIKLFLITKYEKSDLENSYDLLRYMSRGELTPSESLAKVNRMWKDTQKKAFWLRSLEPELRNAITGDNTSTLSELAAKADAILLSNKAYGTDNAVVAVAAVGAAPVVAAVVPTKPKPAQRRKDYSNEPIVDHTGMCFLHRKWGAKAHSCHGAPCSMIGQTTPKTTPSGN